MVPQLFSKSDQSLVSKVISSGSGSKGMFLKLEVNIFEAVSQEANIPNSTRWHRVNGYLRSRDAERLLPLDSLKVDSKEKGSDWSFFGPSCMAYLGLETID